MKAGESLHLGIDCDTRIRQLRVFLRNLDGLVQRSESLFEPIELNESFAENAFVPYGCGVIPLDP